ncbi:MAG: HAD family hydrolase [Acidimicrobiales bacterium]
MGVAVAQQPVVVLLAAAGPVPAVIGATMIGATMIVATMVVGTVVVGTVVVGTVVVGTVVVPVVALAEGAAGIGVVAVGRFGRASAVVMSVVAVVGGVFVVRRDILAAARTVGRVTRAVLFDFYGTLARATEWGPTMEAVLARRGVVIDPAARARWGEIDGLDHADHSVDRDRYVAWEQLRLRSLAEESGTPATDLDALVADMYAASKDYRLAAYDEVAGTLAELRKRGVTVAVCSNWDWDLDRALAKAGLDDLIDIAVTSARAGARKPHPRIYDVTLQDVGVGPADALFVGDTWEPDVDGPRRAGIPAVHLWRAEEHDGPPPDGSIADLAAVLDLVG